MDGGFHLYIVRVAGWDDEWWWRALAGGFIISWRRREVLLCLQHCAGPASSLGCFCSRALAVWARDGQTSDVVCGFQVLGVVGIRATLHDRIRFASGGTTACGFFLKQSNTNPQHTFNPIRNLDR